MTIETLVQQTISPEEIALLASTYTVDRQTEAWLRSSPYTWASAAEPLRVNAAETALRFACLTPEEFEELLITLETSNPELCMHMINNQGLPDAVMQKALLSATVLRAYAVSIASSRFEAYFVLATRSSDPDVRLAGFIRLSHRSNAMIDAAKDECEAVRVIAAKSPVTPDVIRLQLAQDSQDVQMGLTRRPHLQPGILDALIASAYPRVRAVVAATREFFLTVDQLSRLRNDSDPSVVQALQNR